MPGVERLSLFQIVKESDPVAVDGCDKWDSLVSEG